MNKYTVKFYHVSNKDVLHITPALTFSITNFRGVRYSLHLSFLTETIGVYIHFHQN